MPTSTTQPFYPTIPGYKKGTADLTSLYESGGLKYKYGPSRVAGLNSTLTDYWDQTEKRAKEGNPLLDQSQGYYSDVLAGKYLGREAPGFQDVLSKTRDLVNANASAGSRYGGTSHGAELTRELGGLEYQNYLNERGYMDQAAGMAPEMAAADYFDLDRMGQIGGARQQQAQAQTSDEVARFLQEQGAPEDAIARYLALLPGGMGSVNYAPKGAGQPSPNPWLLGAGAVTDLAGSFLGSSGSGSFLSSLFD
jgi:hypothetical protein